jgi:hypothetical protein
VMAHTPTPWIVRPLELFQCGEGVEIVGANGDTVADNQTYYPCAITPDNAALIVAAVNAYTVIKS